MHSQGAISKAIISIRRRHPEACTGVFVDDTCMLSVGNAIEETIDLIIHADILLGGQAKLMHLSLSPKAVVTASNTKLAS